MRGPAIHLLLYLGPHLATRCGRAVVSRDWPFVTIDKEAVTCKTCKKMILVDGGSDEN